MRMGTRTVTMGTRTVETRIRIPVPVSEELGIPGLWRPVWTFWEPCLPVPVTCLRTLTALFEYGFLE